MVRVGVHVSIAGSIAKSVERAQGIGCDAFQGTYSGDASEERPWRDQAAPAAPDSIRRLSA